MDKLFSTVVNMSMTGSIVILLVVLARFFLKRMPKIFSYALWAVVLFRLLCPVSFTAPLSLLEPFQPEVQDTSGATSIVYFIPAEASEDFRFVPAETPAPESTPVAANPKPTWTAKDTLPWFWAAGFGAMILWSGIQYLLLRKKLIGAMPLSKNVYLADRIDMPFVLGILRPRIYLPSGIPEAERKFITAHEQHHIRRGDPLIKMLAFLTLCIHWFNPLVWLAFLLAGRDMEMSCDEAVIRRMGPQIRPDYSAALLRLTAHKKIIAGTPLAFGEGDTKGRVMNMAKWKKPGLLGLAIGLVLCIVLVIVCGANPAATSESSLEPTETIIGKLNLWLPAGLTLEQEQDTGPYVIRNGDAVVGGVQFLQKPVMESDGHVDLWKWVESLDVPENVPEERFMMSAAGWFQDTYCASANYGKQGIVETTHYFFEGETVVYDLWFDMGSIPEAGVSEILSNTRWNSISAESGGPKPKLSFEKLSNGCVPLMDAEENILFTEDGETYFAGVNFYPIPEGVYDPNDTIYLWLEEVGIPDFEDTTLCYMGGMTSEGGWIAEFASDVPPGTEATVNRRHLFLVSGNYVVDIWVDMLMVDNETAEELFSSVTILGSAPETADTDDKEAFAFQKCAAVFNAVQKETYQISQLERTGEFSFYSHTYWQHGSDWMHIRKTLTKAFANDYRKEASLCFGAHYFTNQGHETDMSAITWEESSPIDPIPQPWLARFYWAKANITYMDMLYDTQGCSILYRINKSYEDLDGYADHYFASFNFDSQWQFQGVTLNVNQYQDNAFTVSESIVSLDDESVALDIYAQYSQASGTVETVADHPLDSCWGVIQAIQNMDAWKIVTQRQNFGPDVLNDSSTLCFWRHGINWLHTNTYQDGRDTMVMAACHIDGKSYDTYGPEAGASPEGEPIHWEETDKTEFCIPWLASVQWNKNAVTVTSIKEDATGTTVHLYFQDTFRLGTLEAENYLAKFLFDRNGKFVSATVTVAFSDHISIVETMSVASIDADLIAREIAGLGP